MKVLMISTDRNIFKENSASRKRMVEYGKLVRELYIIIFSLKKNNFENSKISENVFVYPTKSFSRFCYIFNAYKISKKILTGNSKDLLITCQDPFETGIAGFLIKRKFKAPLQIQIHTDFLSSYFVSESILNKLRLVIAKFLIPKVDGIRVVSERIKNSLINLLLHKKFLNKVRDANNCLCGGKFKISDDKIFVLPIFVDAEKIKNTKVAADLRKKYPQFDFIILTASRLTHEKNISLILKAMKMIIKKHSNVGLVIAGVGPLKEKLEKEAENLNIEKNIIFEGNVEFETLISYYKTAGIFAITSNYEGYSMSAVEAVVCGLPVVMTDVGVAGEVLKDKENALIVPVGNAEFFENAIISLIENSALYGKIKENAKKVSELLLSKEEYFKKYYELWDNLLK